MHINEMLNKKTYIGNIEPNPKEFGIWIKEDGTHMIYDYTNNQWVCECSSNSKILYYRIAASASSLVYELLYFAASVKVYDATENRFEYIPIMQAGNNIESFAPNFSFETDECCIAFLPIDTQTALPDGNKHRIAIRTFEDLFLLMGQEIPSEVTRISEEEYWNDTVPELEHTIIIPAGSMPSDYIEISYISGMTWREWLKSAYNRAGDEHNAYVPDNARVRFSENSVLVVYETNESVYLDDTIMPIKYFISYPPI